MENCRNTGPVKTFVMDTNILITVNHQTFPIHTGIQ